LILLRKNNLFRLPNKLKFYTNLIRHSYITKIKEQIKMFKMNISDEMCVIKII